MTRLVDVFRVFAFRMPLRCNCFTAPDVGLEEDIAQFYFNQLISGLVRISLISSIESLPNMLSSRGTYTIKGCAIVISSRRTCSSMSQAVSRSQISAYAQYSGTKRVGRFDC